MQQWSNGAVGSSNKCLVLKVRCCGELGMAGMEFRRDLVAAPENNFSHGLNKRPKSRCSGCSITSQCGHERSMDVERN